MTLSTISYSIVISKLLLLVYYVLCSKLKYKALLNKLTQHRTNKFNKVLHIYIQHPHPIHCSVAEMSTGHGYPALPCPEQEQGK